MVETIINFEAKKLKKVILIDIDDEMVSEFKKALEVKKTEVKKT